MQLISRKLFVAVLLLVSGLLLSGCSNPLFGDKKAGLQVITGDIPASVFIDDQYGEKTPFINKNLAPGNIVVRIEPDNSELVPYETTVTLEPGLLTVITWNPSTRPETSGGVIYEMAKLPDKNKTELSIISIPDRSIVSIDGNNKEFTPVVFTDLEPGEHEYEVSLPSYQIQRHTINLVKGHRVNVTIKLSREAYPQDPGNIAETQPIQDASPSGEITLSPEATPSAQTQPPATPAATLIGLPRVTITPTNFFQNGEEVLRVRDAAGSTGQELGFAPVGEQYKFLGETSQGWYQIDFNGTPGWVSGNYAELEE